MWQSQGRLQTTRGSSSRTSLDPQLSYEIVELLRKINRQNGTTIIMVTHEHDLVKYFGGRIINIENGSITFDENIGGASDEDE